MKFGFLKYSLLAIVLILAGAFVWLAVVDVPVQQQEIIVDVPVSDGR